ncbi:ornithine carbamoyltransferase [Psychrobium sp. 1_MG-2023]|uniref:ornithine carbamoyltransferase n=1 Tax=Psychrobium sp. 1_MG-2023 TaxID=3062624 RepID=UPI000C34F53F|nr:ornithine carbamoyltransferase [Psychrobium sp. 1_MG-2023]MDP2561002.1 ornithine carbamoyltransferase [Psychrobium sp. 1_MG-2023]PKF58296.1 ornithine carbamoyltransferase [Alteromonadales bacterium alter-6D02]
MEKLQHLLTLKDLSQEQLLGLLELAKQVKANPSEFSQALAGKSIVTLYEKPSLRTRVTFDIGIAKLGGHTVYLDQNNGALGKRESVADFAKNISCWADGIVARTFSHKTVEELAEHGRVPVVNSLSDMYHPCQGLADFLALSEQFDDLSNVKLAYIGDGNNVTHSLMFAAAITGAEMVVICPEGCFPDGKVVLEAQALAAHYGGSLELSTDPKAAQNADAVYADTWISMGDDVSYEDIKDKFAPYQVNQQMMDSLEIGYFMHCQPAHIGQEVTQEVFDGDKSLVLQQAENRMHAQNAVLITLLA